MCKRETTDNEAVQENIRLKIIGYAEKYLPGVKESLDSVVPVPDKKDLYYLTLRDTLNLSKTEYYSKHEQPPVHIAISVELLNFRTILVRNDGQLVMPILADISQYPIPNIGALPITSLGIDLVSGNRTLRLNGTLLVSFPFIDETLASGLMLDSSDNIIEFLYEESTRIPAANITFDYGLSILEPELKIATISIVSDLRYKLHLAESVTLFLPRSGTRIPLKALAVDNDGCFLTADLLYPPNRKKN